MELQLWQKIRQFPLKHRRFFLCFRGNFAAIGNFWLVHIVGRWVGVYGRWRRRIRIHVFFLRSPMGYNASCKIKHKFN